MFLLTSVSAIAQSDVHFSQFYSSPLFLNPGATGAFDGDIRAMTNYRNQWNSVMSKPYNTIAFSVDAPVWRPGKTNNFLAVGGQVYSDKSGDSKFKSTNFGLDLAYGIGMGKTSFLSMGLNFGVLQRAITPGSLTWDNQWDGTAFNTSLSNGETSFSEAFTTFDISGGLHFYTFTDENMFQAGVSVSHFNRPRVNFLGEDDKLLIKYLLHAGGEFRMGRSNSALMPSAIFFIQGPNMELSFGTDYKIIIKEASKRLSFNDEISIQAGLYLRFMDAIYPTFRFNYAGFSVGGAYDFTMSTLTPAANSLGGFEVFLQYRHTFGSAGSGVSSFR